MTGAFPVLLETAVSDYDEIANLIAAYGHIYDDGRLEEWAELFKHASYTFLGKKFEGKELLDWITSVSIRGAAKHVNFNIAISVDGNRASAVSDFVTVARDPTGRFKADIPEALWGRYEDTFEKVDGKWRFSSRVDSVDNAEAAAKVWERMRLNASVHANRSADLYKE
jgi:hypothetical protein